MFNKILLSAAFAVGLAGGVAAEVEIEDVAFSYEGPFGKFDQQQLQRGLQVFTDVCSSCHGLKFVYFRNLGDSGGPMLELDQVKAYAAMVEIYDFEADDYRPAIPSDNFPENNDAGAPDLSVMAKARAGFSGPNGLGINQFIRGVGGPEYIVALLNGYTGEEKEQAGTILYENEAFPGGWISMPQPLWGQDVEYEDGSSNELHDEAMDVSAFLMWTAEPKLMDRKNAGLVAVIFLIFFAVLLYLTNKRIWAKVKRKD